MPGGDEDKETSPTWQTNVSLEEGSMSGLYQGQLSSPANVQRSKGQLSSRENLPDEQPELREWIDVQESRPSTVLPRATADELRKNGKKKVVNVLSLDGGGLRGVFSCQFVEAIEKECGKPIHEIFDLIMGTSTGGLIAMLLATGRRNATECEDIFYALGVIVSQGSEDVSAREFERMARSTYDKLRLNSHDCKTKCAVTAVKVDRHPAQGCIFRSYREQDMVKGFSPFTSLHDISCWLAARCTAALPLFLKPKKIERLNEATNETVNIGSFVDGGMWLSDPAFAAKMEASCIFGMDAEVRLVSIGTGIGKSTEREDHGDRQTLLSALEAQGDLAFLSKQLSMMDENGKTPNFLRLDGPLGEETSPWRAELLKEYRAWGRNAVKAQEGKLKEFCAKLMNKVPTASTKEDFATAFGVEEEKSMSAYQQGSGWGAKPRVGQRFSRPVLEMIMKRNPALDTSKIHWYDNNEETDDRWEALLHSYNKEWVELMFFSSLPGALTFAGAIILSVKEGAWYAVATGTLYSEGAFFVPSILENHMMFACWMLVLLTMQVGLAACGLHIDKDDITIDFFKWHKRFGWLPSFITYAAVLLGTLALAFCDLQPKRGAENVFFVMVGISIAVTMTQALVYVKRGFRGLHMQYMFYCVYAICSPGWNRIVSVFVRWTYNAFSDAHMKHCFVRKTWMADGYYYTYSFVAGEVWMGCWWLVVYRAPFFKKYSVGFWMVAMQSVILFACIWEMAYHRVGDVDCSEEELMAFKVWTEATASKGLYSMTHSFGLCAPRISEDPQGVNTMFAKYPATFAPGDDLHDHFASNNVTDWMNSHNYNFGSELERMMEALNEYLVHTTTN